MFETHLTIVGLATTAPWRLRSERTGATGAKLRMISTSRRYDKAQGQWVDGDRLFVEVVCWRDLAEHVCASVFKGDPLIVTGRLYTRDYEVDGRRRWAYEIDAMSVGHDMARGTSQFNRPEPAGWPAEVTDPAADIEAPVRAGDGNDDTRDLAAARTAAPVVPIADAPAEVSKRPITPPAAFVA